MSRLLDPFVWPCSRYLAVCGTLGLLLVGCQPRTSTTVGALDESTTTPGTPEPRRGSPTAVSPSSSWPPDGASEGHIGVLLARRALEVSAEVEGRLESVDVEVGDRLAPGDIIATIDTSEVEQELASARAALAAARAAAP